MNHYLVHRYQHKGPFKAAEKWHVSGYLMALTATRLQRSFYIFQISQIKKTKSFICTCVQPYITLIKVGTPGVSQSCAHSVGLKLSYDGFSTRNLWVKRLFLTWLGSLKLRENDTIHQILLLFRQLQDTFMRVAHGLFALHMHDMHKTCWAVTARQQEEK